MITLGLDTSLVKTGFAVIENGKCINSGLIKSVPSGDKPIDELLRIIQIVDKIAEVVPENTGLAAVENLAFLARNTTALTQLSALNYFVRRMLMEKGIPFVLVAPTSLKKHTTGRGNADKNLMMMELYKQYGHSSLDDNECDAYALAALASSVLGKPINKPTKPQSEVVELIKKQVC